MSEKFQFIATPTKECRDDPICKYIEKTKCKLDLYVQIQCPQLCGECFSLGNFLKLLFIIYMI